ncbi:hypothetical protein K435DRAFT_323924 [Dendrothele bispora CBS 962.96]|uniref:Uncharacterized protein n=1 Tax=Dendrothele bispora (strain CBS 962.96) TaxID=1314807 RepID=A0A4S8LG92_DENBC|nr:hypothetical protein K435DRAFT_323924 [Dendrothele bispora CBS 962.96]
MHLGINHVCSECSPSLISTTPATLLCARLQQTVSKYHFPSLRKLQLSSSFPIDSFVDTMTHLASSPIECIEMQCYEDDTVDACKRLKKFIALRMVKLPKGRFFENLQRIDFVAVQDLDLPWARDLEEEEEEEYKRAKAIKKLKRTCRKAKLLSSVSEATFSRELVELDLDQREQVYASTNFPLPT